MNNLGGMAIDFSDLIVIHFYSIDDFNDISSILVQFLQIRDILFELSPELFVQLS